MLGNIKIFLAVLIIGILGFFFFLLVQETDPIIKEPIPEIAEKSFEYVGERQAIQVFDPEGSLILEYSIEEFNQWTKENWHIFDEPPEVGMREVEPGNFGWFDKSASISPDFEKLAFSVHDYALASYASFIGVIDIETGEPGLVKDYARGSIDELIWSPQSSHIAYKLGTGRAQGDYLAVAGAENLREEFVLSEKDLLEALGYDREEFPSLMPEFRQLNWLAEGERLEFVANKPDRGSIKWSIKNSGEGLQKAEEQKGE